MIDRRVFLGTATGAMITAQARVAFAGAEADKRFVVVMLRGAMDGLSAVPAYGDPDYAGMRTGLAVPKPGERDGALKLDGFFGLHPALSGLGRRFAAGELLVFHAIASPYRDRSHFDGQNLLENGSPKPFGLTDGWLNRAMSALPGPLRSSRREYGVALAPAMPLMLRGSAPVTSWSPSILPAPDQDLVARLGRLYRETDPKLASALEGAAQANGVTGMSGTGRAGGAGDLVTLMGAAARFLSSPNGPCVAMVESTGWDTHANQVGPYGVLNRNLMALDRGLEELAVGMGGLWKQTAVMIVTEFGRTVQMNGTTGSDHGNGGAAFLLGGAVAGGRVLAEWPGLARGNLHEGRDLRPTTDLRSLMKAALVDHLGIPAAFVERVVFPESAVARPLAGLFRA
jgi:uncharacterized protein (DUF1501 family)